MRVLVTGHNGYIGSVMVPVLRMAGHDVVGLDTFFFEDCTLRADEGRVRAIRKDIRDALQAKQRVERTSHWTPERFEKVLETKRQVPGGLATRRIDQPQVRVIEQQTDGDPGFA